MDNIDLIDFNATNDGSSIIKVIGVGGGGGNAVNHMFREGIKDVNFVICNTDNQALETSPITRKIQLGPVTTGGLGAGNNPERARQAAEESIDEIKTELSMNTKMVFITAGMGGGTGTGAAPVIAKIAKELGILTVGIVTIPFAFEGSRKIAQALEGVRLMNENVDALLVINNERLRDIYPGLELANAFAKADDVLKDAAKGIAEIITIHGHINVDFADVDTIMRGGGVAIMNTGYASGENRLRRAIDNALSSPLLRNNNITGAKKILLNFYCRQDGTSIIMDEIAQINEFMEEVGDAEQVIWGISFNDFLEEEVKVTIIATGFGVDDVTVPVRKAPIVMQHTPTEPIVPKPLPLAKEPEPEMLLTMEDDLEETLVSLTDEPVVSLEEETSFDIPVIDLEEEKIFEPEQPPVTSRQEPQPKAQDDLFEKYYGDTKIEQKKKETTFSNMAQQLDNEKVVDELENVPAYKRRQSGEGPKLFKFGR
jgi:cell division protein FtsZ